MGEGKNKAEIVMGTWNGRVRMEIDSASENVRLDVDSDTARVMAQQLLSAAEKIDGLESVITQPNRFISGGIKQETTE